MVQDCVPKPCNTLLRRSNLNPCEHFVKAPHNVNVKFGNMANKEHETVVVSWQPSEEGIEFLVGFQISVQIPGGEVAGCQLLLFNSNLSLEVGKSQQVYQSDPFPNLELGTEYVVTVIALPVPEQWENYYTAKFFRTRSCTQINGVEKCRADWSPRNITMYQEGRDAILSFSMAPPQLNIENYFAFCSGDKINKYTNVPGIAADIEDAKRKVYKFMLEDTSPQSGIWTNSLLFIICITLFLLSVFFLLILLFYQRKKRKGNKGKLVFPEENHLDSISSDSPILGHIRPQVFILYSSSDGPYHVAVVLQFAVFLQQHAAVQVSLDLWEQLQIAEHGKMNWLCKKIEESDFVLVVCSQGMYKMSNRQMVTQVNEAIDVSIAGISMIAEDMYRAKSQGLSMSKYITVTFEYTSEQYIPKMLYLASRYHLMFNLPLLFSHLHQVQMHKPGIQLHVDVMTPEGYIKVPSGSSLYCALHKATQIYNET
ncbi:interleukin-17 receptor D isoform X2 [Erpetoichthys calabaricus]|uniref:interleukin-17 receptor D isoform X2 n=1 Tax=Erpetoichthys calabaricus TaxID=27687 RepID=UPI0022347004|nr:interleukin-17 receptor D isoform X2 [Erpetoichthys calabaricus]